MNSAAAAAKTGHIHPSHRMTYHPSSPACGQNSEVSSVVKAVSVARSRETALPVAYRPGWSTTGGSSRTTRSNRPRTPSGLRIDTPGRSPHPACGCRGRAGPSQPLSRPDRGYTGPRPYGCPPALCRARHTDLTQVRLQPPGPRYLNAGHRDGRCLNRQAAGLRRKGRDRPRDDTGVDRGGTQALDRRAMPRPPVACAAGERYSRTSRPAGSHWRKPAESPRARLHVRARRPIRYHGKRLACCNDTPGQDTRRSRACVRLAAIVHRRLLCRVSPNEERGRSCHAGGRKL